MKLFMLKSLIVVSLMFISVLAGMQIANESMTQMRGKEQSQSLPAANENSGMASSDGDITSHNLKAKKQKLEEMNALNLFSAMGKKMADGVSKTSESIIHSIANE